MLIIEIAYLCLLITLQLNDACRLESIRIGNLFSISCYVSLNFELRDADAGWMED